MSVNEVSPDNWINETIATQLPELWMLLSLEDSELLAKLVREIVQPSNVSIILSLVGAYGQQRFFFNMDSALLVNHTLAPQGARIVVALKIPARELTTLVQPGDDLYGFEKEKDVYCFGGSFPCWSGRRLLGGISISGGSAEKDMLTACQAMAQFSILRYPLTATR